MAILGITYSVLDRRTTTLAALGFPKKHINTKFPTYCIPGLL